MKEEDEYYDEAVKIVRIEGKASVSFLQRKLRLSYFRAEKIMESLENNKIVGPYNGAKPREVLPFNTIN